LSMAIRAFALIAASGFTVFTSNLHAEEWTKRWQVSGRPELRLSTQDASIQLEVGSGNEIEAVVRTRGYSIGDGGVKIFEHQSGNRIEMEVREPSSHFSFGNHSINVSVRVPRDLVADVHSGDGSIKLTGLHGALHINTGDGSIQGQDLDGELDARSGDGSIHIDGRFDKLQARTSDGSVSVRAAAGSKMNADWRVETGDGSVRLDLPRDLAANVQLRTGDGSIHLDLPVTIQGNKSEHELEGKLNGGGPFLEVHTGDGSISLGAS
jgi:DUF4097 and DUF4098 domain-containing protein YvlB